MSNLMDLFTFRRGLDWTLVEMNKAISLAGLTGFILAFVPAFKADSREMIFVSMNLLWIHGAYSVYKFYSFSLKRFQAEKPIKQLSVALAVAGQLVLSGGYFGFLSYPTLLYGGIVLGMAHFWTMEVDYKYVLQVRPFAYLPFILAPAVIVYHFFF